MCEYRSLQRGEVDWYEQPPPEQLSLLRRNASISVERTTPFPSCGLLRFNFLHPPFNVTAQVISLEGALTGHG